MTIDILRESLLSQDMLDRFGGRAAIYDRENRFFSEDFDDLREAGYLKLAIPYELGGHGLTLADPATTDGNRSFRQRTQDGH